MKKARNKSRKKKPVSNQEGFLFVGPAACILLLVAGVSLTYLHLHNQCDLLGRDIHELETELERVKGRSLYEQSKWSSMITLDGVVRAVERHSLDMSWPQPNRVVKVSNHLRPAQLAMVAGHPAWGDKVVHD